MGSLPGLATFLGNAAEHGDTHEWRLPHPIDDLAADTIVGQFRVIRLLDRGGMGSVYLARDVKLGRKVALKLIRAELLGTAGAVERFLFEARTTASFSHPHIVTVYSVGEYQGTPFVALEYLDGETLRARLQNARPSQNEALRIALAIADALSEAHRHGILHRDLKPANVIIPRDGRLRVVDFGLAKAVDAADTRDEARPPTVPPEEIFTSGAEAIFGTPMYMAPEQWRGEATPASDVWALGLMLAELVSGAYPFEGLSATEMRERVTSDAPLALRAGDEPVASLVAACVAKDPAARPSSLEVAAKLGALLSRGRAHEDGDESPFRGLSSFGEQHHELFFGRDAEVSSFLERMREQSILPVVGPSGVGKSSFVQAGVLARLRERGGWHALVVRPGRAPFRALAARIQALRQKDASGSSNSEGIAATAAAMLEAPGLLGLELERLAAELGGNIMLVVDALEEIYTLVADVEERDRFLLALATAADDPANPVRVVFTLRDDFLGKIAERAEVRTVLGRVFVLQRPDERALAATLLGPAAAVGYRYDDDALVPDMLREVRGERACLPLLQFAAGLLWERRDRSERCLRRSDYEAIGGVSGALAKHADAVLDGMSPEQEQLARKILLRLVTPERTRQSLGRADLLEGADEAAAGVVLDRLVAARLLTMSRARGGQGGGSVELAHESLVEQWARLARWIDETREDALLLDELSRAAELWRKHGAPADGTWRGEALAGAERAIARLGDRAPEVVRRFVAAGTRRRRRARLSRRGAVLALGLAALAAALGAFAFARQRSEARTQRDAAQGRLAESLLEGAVAAEHRKELPEARAKLRGSLEIGDSLVARALAWRLAGERLVWMRSLPYNPSPPSIAPDGASVAVGSSHTLLEFDVATGERRTLERHEDLVTGVAYSDDGALVVASSDDGELRVVTRASGAVRVLRGGRATMSSGGALSRDGRYYSRSDQLGVEVWDLAAGAIHFAVQGGRMANSAGVSSDGRTSAFTAPDSLTVFDLASKQAVASRPCRGTAVTLAPDGHTIACATADSVALLDVDAGVPVTELRGSISESDAVETTSRALAFSGDSALLAAGSGGTVIVWDVAQRVQRAELAHDGVVTGIAFSRASDLLAVTTRTARLYLWRVSTAPAPAPSGGHTGWVLRAAFTPDGKRVVSASADKTVRIWDVATGRPIHTLRHAAESWAVAVSNDGARIATGSALGEVYLWDAQSGARQMTLRGDAHVRGVAWSGDDRRVAIADAAGLRVWDLASDSVVLRLGLPPNGAFTPAFHPDGGEVAVAALDGAIHLVPLDSDAAPRTLSGHTQPVRGVAYLPGGAALVSGSEDGTVRLWDRASGTHRIVGRHGDRVYFVAAHPDGKHVGSPSSDGTARIWDLATGQFLSLEGHPDECNGMAFSRDGTLAATTSDHAMVRVYHADSGRALWRSPLLRASPLEMWSHRGWERLDGEPVERPEAAWRRAVETAADARIAGATLCLMTDRGVAAWDVERDVELFHEDSGKPAAVLARAGGCVALVAGAVRSFGAGGERRELATGATAVAVESGSRLLIAHKQQVELVDAAGVAQSSWETDQPVTALARVGERLILGSPSGELWALPFAGKAARASFDHTPAHPVTAVAEGPGGVVLAGFAHGELAIFDPESGAQLYAARLHGPVVHLVRQGTVVAAGSDLGDEVAWDLTTLETPYCELLQRVWADTPIAWQGGRVVAQPPPREHRCAR